MSEFSMENTCNINACPNSGETSKFEKQKNHTSPKKRQQSFLKICCFRTWAAQQFLFDTFRAKFSKTFITWTRAKCTPTTHELVSMIKIKLWLRLFGVTTHRHKRWHQELFCLITSLQNFPRVWQISHLTWKLEIHEGYRMRMTHLLSTHPLT